MTTLSDVMLRAAQIMGGIHYGVAETGSDSTTIIDTRLDLNQGDYDEAVLWVLSGDNAGACFTVERSYKNTLEFSALAADMQAGDEYAVAEASLFPLTQLKVAVISALRDHPVMLKNTDLTTVEDQFRYELPAGVNDVRRIAYIEDDQYKTLVDWQELPGEIEFYKEPEKDLDLILFYSGNHPWIELDDHIQGSWNLTALAWAAVVNLYRDYIVRFQKDNPTALEMFNEAKMAEAELGRQYQNIPALIAVEGRYRPFGV